MTKDLSAPLTLEKLREFIHNGEASDPLVFLESVMNGRDPRKLSKLSELIIEIDEFTEGDISKEDWDEIIKLALSQYKYKDVSINDSRLAANTLAEYLYPKRKNTEKSSNDHVRHGDGVGEGSLDLSEEEITLFKEKFNEEY